MYILYVIGLCVSHGGSGSVQTYPYLESDPCGPKRTHDETCKHSEEALLSGTNVNYSKHT